MIVYRVVYDSDGLPIGIPYDTETGEDVPDGKRLTWPKPVRGDFSAYYVRDPGSFRFEPSTAPYFDE